MPRKKKTEYEKLWEYTYKMLCCGEAWASPALKEVAFERKHIMQARRKLLAMQKAYHIEQAAKEPSA